MNRPFKRRDVLLGGAFAMATFAASASGCKRSANDGSGTVSIAHQLGLSYLPLHVMKLKRLVEAQAESDGFTLHARYLQLANGSSVNEALISRNADFGAVSLAPMITLIERTRGSLQVKGVAPVDASGLSLNTNTPRIASLGDFNENDRIAMPDAGVSFQALMLRIAAEKTFGPKEAKSLDRLTVSMPHPEAANALISGRTEIVAHFATAPFLFQELEAPNISQVLNSIDILDGPATFINLVAGAAYRTNNFEAYRTVLAALRSAQVWIAENVDEAAKLYIEAERSALSPKFVARILRDPLVRYSPIPENTLRLAEFAHRLGNAETAVSSWKELYFEDIHDLQGS